MNKVIGDEDADGIRELCNVIGPTLEQAIRNGVTEALLDVDAFRANIAQKDPSAILQAYPRHEAMERMLWMNVYSHSIGRNEDPNEAADSADRAITAYNERFLK